MKNRPNRRGKPLEGDRGRAEHARRQQQEEARSTTRSRTPSDAVSMVRTDTLAANFDNTVLGGGLQIQASRMEFGFPRSAGGIARRPNP
jgi:hypothetical protein